MNILVIGAGVWVRPAAAIAARRTFFDRFVLADYDEARARDAVARIDDKRFAASAWMRRTRTEWPSWRRAGERRRGAQCVRPPPQPTDLRRRVRGGPHVHRHGDAPVATASRIVRTRRPARSSATTVRRGGPRGRSGDSSRSSDWASSPGSPTCSLATPPTTCSRRSTRSACATAPTSRSTATTSRRRSRSGRRSRSA